jgi:hypothetical protein
LAIFANFLRKQKSQSCDNFFSLKPGLCTQTVRFLHPSKKKEYSFMSVPFLPKMDLFLLVVSTRLRYFVFWVKIAICPFLSFVLV